MSQQLRRHLLVPITFEISGGDTPYLSVKLHEDYKFHSLFRNTYSLKGDSHNRIINLLINQFENFSFTIRKEMY